ncbi:hypothetical protein [Limnohabitans sp.]|uniref:hypothetical protein n=1 Tax=Limnohabitans sp. TaxID=1907725 RepID=UPI0028A28DD0|nr:hypothetical protein [Limnohabitans sp.]
MRSGASKSRSTPVERLFAFKLGIAETSRINDVLADAWFVAADTDSRGGLFGQSSQTTPTEAPHVQRPP